MVQDNVELPLEDERDLLPELVALVVVPLKQDGEGFLDYFDQRDTVVVEPQFGDGLIDVVLHYLSSHRGVEVLLDVHVRAVAVDEGQELQVQTLLVCHVLQLSYAHNWKRLEVEPVAEGFACIGHMQSQFPQLP